MLYTLVLIALKIWLHERRSSAIIALRPRTLVPVMWTVVESGAIYSTTLLALFIAYLSRNWAHCIILDMVCSIFFRSYSSDADIRISLQMVQLIVWIYFQLLIENRKLTYF